MCFLFFHVFIFWGERAGGIFPSSDFDPEYLYALFSLSPSPTRVPIVVIGRCVYRIARLRERCSSVRGSRTLHYFVLFCRIIFTLPLFKQNPLGYFSCLFTRMVATFKNFKHNLKSRSITEDALPSDEALDQQITAKISQSVVSQTLKRYQGKMYTMTQWLLKRGKSVMDAKEFSRFLESGAKGGKPITNGNSAKAWRTAWGLS